MEYGWRSGLEASVATQLRAAGVEFEYEKLVLEFQQPARARTYRPDFIITTRTGKVLVVETKGRFLTADRQKIEMVLAQNTLDFRMVFSNAQQRISKTSRTTYAAWCTKRGIPWATRVVPQGWLDE